MKIIITSNSLWNIINFRKELIDVLSNQNHHIYILTKNDKKYEKNFNNLNITINNVQISRKIISPLKDFVLLFQYFYYFLKIKPDIIFSFTVKPNIISSIVSKILNIKHISTITGLGTHVLSNIFIKKIIDFLYKISLSKNKTIFVQNNFDRKYFIEEIKIKSHIIKKINGSGVNLEIFKYNDFNNTSKNIVNFVFIGRLISDKGIIEYLKCAEIIKNQRKNINFEVVAIVDKKNISSISKNFINYYIDKNIITYYENEKNVVSFINKASCIVLPSYREGLPKTLLEAIAIGRPIIASDVPGCNELVINDFNGFLFETKNLNDLIMKINNFIDLDFYQKKTFADNSYSMVKKFDIDIIIKKYLNEL